MIQKAVSSPIPAVRYVPKSKQQQDSVDHQKAAIKEYANSHGMAIVRTYADPPQETRAIKQR